MTPTRPVALLADDLIWATRLDKLLRSLGRDVLRARDIPTLTEVLPLSDEVLVDLTARAYDGLAGVEMAAHAGHRVLCVAQHDDLDLRRDALAAGAERVVPYRAVAEHGPDVLGRWFGRPAGAGAETAS